MPSTTVAVIGLGCPGLPLVVECAQHGRTIGCDIQKRVVPYCRTHQDDDTVGVVAHGGYAALVAGAHAGEA